MDETKDATEIHRLKGEGRSWNGSYAPGVETQQFRLEVVRKLKSGYSRCWRTPDVSKVLTGDLDNY